MTKLSTSFIILFSFFCCAKTSAAIRLIALSDAGNPIVTLRWNMVNYPGNTAYILYKSVDGVVWETAAANPVFRNYSASTILAYRDKFSDETQLYYRVKVYDGNENIVEVSNTTSVNNPVEKMYRVSKPKKNNDNDDANNETVNEPESTTGAAWQIVPNPVSDVLNIIYKRKNVIKGVINVIVQDATGKAVVKFRAASNNQQLHIPVSNLHAGIYFIKINVGTDVQLNDRFIKS